MSLSRKHFCAVASAMKRANIRVESGAEAKAVMEQLEADLRAFFREENSAFDPAKFHFACQA